MKGPKYDPLDGALAALEPEGPPTVHPVAASGSSSASAPSMERRRSGSKRRSTRVQLNLNVAPATKTGLRNAWAPIAAAHTQGELLDYLVARYGEQAAAELAEASADATVIG